MNDYDIRYVGVEATTKLYKYMTFQQFVSLIVTKKMYLSSVLRWDDPWEVALWKLPVMINGVPSEGSSFNILKKIYAQCWSRTRDSDALWRIYSPNRDGIMISTSVRKLKTLDIAKGIIGEVVYTDFKDKNKFPEFGSFEMALLKRLEFSHEKEVRLVTYNHFIKSYHEEFNMEDGAEKRIAERGAIYVEVPITEFIEEIVIDPRASEWVIQTIKQFCENAGLCIVPQKSALYHFDENSISYRLNFVSVEDE